MKFIFMISTFVFATQFLTPVYAEDPSVAYTLDYTSKYIFRGWDLTPNNKSAVQPGVSYSKGSIGVWLLVFICGEQQGRAWFFRRVRPLFFVQRIIKWNHRVFRRFDILLMVERR